MDFAPIEAFVAVAQTGGVQPAAARLHRSPASVSRHVQRLEDELSIELFVRASGRGLTLTTAGERLLSSSVALLGAVEHQLGEFRAEARGEQQRVHVGMTLLMAFSPVVDDLCLDFARAHPDITLDIAERTHPSLLVTQLANATIDVAITPLGPQVEAGGLETVEFMSFFPRVVVARDHALADRREIGLAELAAQPLGLLRGSADHERVLEACRARGIALPGLVEFDEALTLAVRVASAELATVLTAEPTLRPPGPAEVTARFVSIALRNDGLGVPVALCWSAERRMSRAARAFTKFAIPRLQAHDPTFQAA